MRSFEIHSAAVCVRYSDYSDCRVLTSFYFTVSALFWKLQPHSVQFTFVAFSRFYFSVKEPGVAAVRYLRGRRFTLYTGVLALCALRRGLFGGVKHTRRQKTQKKKNTKKKPSMSRSDADATRALPDGFFIPLLFSRSFAICDVKKPNLIVRSGQMSELTHSCHNRIFFSTCVQKNTSRILKFFNFSTKKYRT